VIASDCASYRETQHFTQHVNFIRFAPEAGYLVFALMEESAVQLGQMAFVSNEVEDLPGSMLAAFEPDSRVDNSRILSVV
jgi:hypothetical protein